MQALRHYFASVLLEGGAYLGHVGLGFSLRSSILLI